MNTMQEDNKIVDLITFIGDPFPKTASFLTDSGSENTRPDHLHGSLSCDEGKEDDVIKLDSGTKLTESALCLNELIVDDSEPLIRAVIKPHEGVCSYDPFDIHPKQMVKR